ncbi:hypothetical protein [Burkholderia pyrrocinia]|uniref:hypothetical protein n=1 Tax=Burkholderia pyrrocinia TaxID=60550 RepID=UPI001589BE2B|nr:hypothetical protein [Burkholderia pyrrocinia]
MNKTLTDLAHEIYAAAQTVPEEGIEDAAGRIEAILAAQQPELTDSDVFTLIGHAELLHGRGETDMPAWCLDLAHRIANGIDESLAARVAEIKVKCEKPPAAQSQEPRAEVTDTLRERVRHAVAEALGEAYDCMRVWSAWGVGTMAADDFRLVADDPERVAEIADAAINAARAGNAS